MSQQFELLYLENLNCSWRVVDAKTREILWIGNNPKDSHNKLFTEDTAIEEITNSAFPSLANADEEKFNDMYIYTASVCDIILNPNCPTLEVSKAAIELRLKKFRVSIEFILLFKKLNLLNKIKIRMHLMKKV